ncbi:hypothetical protein FNV43_RR27144 [Rhamnella rubrinervis]|uniref:Uncharacterized protein n=1 Tax=Rhamnella rubrinervis TaxID=2594499 RepID=A0A8K0DQH3_9ROSA|nr:hypothetical protein FNV43_RR27144 [Rhamnella rubrinervis]
MVHRNPVVLARARETSVKTVRSGRLQPSTGFTKLVYPSFGPDRNSFLWPPISGGQAPKSSSQYSSHKQRKTKGVVKENVNVGEDCDNVDVKMKRMFTVRSYSNCSRDGHNVKMCLFD